MRARTALLSLFFVFLLPVVALAQTATWTLLAFEEQGCRWGTVVSLTIGRAALLQPWA